ncbi:mutS protein homolog 4 [Fopius arisanus]|uniref:MutS protein homolog 4 n=1 Tax=Fopius arisanus TaxID=64838 RepID=A0A9R1T0S1_9HYME|nr:PREDICTED: mutS protein homolog 4-like [Fopius arisanus]
MNVISQENSLGMVRTRDRGRNGGKIGKIAKDKAPISLIPKHRIPEYQKPLVNMGPSIALKAPRIPRKSNNFSQVNTSSSNSTRRGTPQFLSTDTSSVTPSESAYGDNHFVIVAVTSGRGQARGEVGIAAIDLEYPHIILCQMSDDNSYVNALTKINIFRPVEILIPDTMGKDQKDPNSLYTAIRACFPTTEITEISRIHWNAGSGLERIQTHSVEKFSSIELIVRPKYYALSAVCTLFKYIESIQHTIYTERSVRFEYQVAENATIIDLQSAQDLELVTSNGNRSNFCLLGAIDRCSTPAGRRLLRASILQPPKDISIMEKRLDCVSELISNKSLYSIIHSVVRKLYGVHRLLNFSVQHPKGETVVCAERCLNYALLLKHTLEIVPELKAALDTTISSFFRGVLEDLQHEDFEIMKNDVLRFMSPDARSVKGFTSSTYNRCFAIKFGICDTLDVVRKTYCELIDDMEKMVEEIGRTHNLGLYLACSSTLGYHMEMKVPRYYKFDVTKLPKELIEAHVKGGIAYMTTEDLFVKNLHCKDNCDEIHRISTIVLGKMFDRIRERMSCLFHFNDNIAELDLILSLATVSSISGFVRPTFGSRIDVRDGKHPVLDILGDESPKPNDIVASTVYNFHTIAGPNMGGKSVYLKQIVLLQIMAQIGCYVPATAAKFRISDHIFCKMGVRDDIVFNSSTFMMEMKEAQYILQSLTPTSLVILDELCRSTTVEEGASIAWAISKKLLLSKAFTFSATHFEYLLKMAELYPNVTNHYLEAILRENGSLIYTHQLKQGVQRIQNYGLILARSTGLPEDVLADADRILRQIEESMDSNPPSAAPEEPNALTDSKIKRNYDRLAEVFSKLEENHEVPDEEIYDLIRGLESISYDDLPPEDANSCPQGDNSSSETSGLYSAGPKDSTTSRSLSQSETPAGTSSNRTSANSVSQTRKNTKRHVTFSPALELKPPKAKISKLQGFTTSSPSTRQPLATMNPPPDVNSPFKVPQKPILKKCLTEDPESPFFIPRSQQSGKTLYMSSSSQNSSGSFVEPLRKDGQQDNLRKLQSLTARRGGVVKKKSSLMDMMPKNVHHLFPSMRASLQGSRNLAMSSQPVPQTSYSPDVIASLPKSLRPVGDDTFFPPEFSHLRHLAKNIYDEDEGDPRLLNQYYFMSKTVKRTPGSSTNESEGMERITSPSFTNFSPVFNDEAGADDAGRFAMGNTLQDPIDPGVMIVLTSESEEDEDNCSMSSIEARIAVTKKEAAIFRQIEGNNFDETKFLEDLQKHLQ